MILILKVRSKNLNGQLSIYKIVLKNKFQHGELETLLNEQKKVLRLENHCAFCKVKNKPVFFLYELLNNFFNFTQLHYGGFKLYELAVYSTDG